MWSSINDIRTFLEFFNPYSVFLSNIWQVPIEKDFPYPFVPSLFQKVLILSLSYQTEMLVHTGSPRYMRTFYLRFHVYAIEIMAFLRNISSYLPMLLVSLYANLLYANHFFSPYLSHITRSTCTLNKNFFNLKPLGTKKSNLPPARRHSIGLYTHSPLTSNFETILLLSKSVVLNLLSYVDP